jgi:hypothetical protein
MKGTKKKLIFKNKKKRKTNKLKKRKTYKKKLIFKNKKKRKTFKRKLVGGVNINLSDNPDSRQNIKILAPFGENMQDITKPIEDLFKEDGFDEDDDDPDPPTFLQLENAFKKGLIKFPIEGISRDQIDKLQIKIYTVDCKNAVTRKLVYTTGQENREGENYLEEDTTYLIIPNHEDDKIKAALKDPVQGNMFGMTVSNVTAQNARAHLNCPGTRIGDVSNRIEDAEELAKKQIIKQLDEKIQSLNKALAKLPKDNTQSRELVNKLLDNLKEKRKLELQKLKENSPVISREPSSLGTDELKAEEIEPVPASLMGVVTPAEETEPVSVQAPTIEGNGPAEEKSDDRAAAEDEPAPTPDQIRGWMYWDSISDIPEEPPPKEFINLPEENVSRDKRRAEDNLGPDAKKQKRKKDDKGGKKTRYRTKNRK